MRMTSNITISRECAFYEYGPDRHVLRTPDNRHFLITSTSRELLERLQARQSLQDICASLAQPGEPVSTDELARLLWERFAHLKILENLSPVAPQVDKSVARPRSRGASVLLRCGNVLSARRVNDIANALRIFYQLPVFCIFVPVVIYLHCAIYAHAAKTFSPLFNATSALVTLLITLGSILFHEIGHAAALRISGERPGPIGFGFYLLLPSFFTDVTRTWALRPTARYLVDLGGIYFQQIAFCVLACLTLYTNSSETASACYAIDVMCVIAINPVFQFDGYWLLADWLGLPKLYRDASQVPGDFVFRLLGIPKKKPRPRPRFDSPVKLLAFYLYMICAHFFMVAAIVASFRYLNSEMMFIHHAVWDNFIALRGAFRAHAFAQEVNISSRMMIAFLFIGSTIAGIFMYANKSVRYLGRAWHLVLHR